MARCYIMASISNVLQAQHEDYDNASDIIANLVDMFEGQVATKGQAALRQLLNLRQQPGTPVKDHMILVMSLIAEMNAHGADMDYLPQMTMVFETLSKEFVPFKTT